MKRGKILHTAARVLALPLALLTASTIAGAAEAEKGPYNKNQKEYYLSAQELAFIRPGLVIEIADASIDSAGKIEVRFTVTDPKGLPLDRNGVFTPGAVSSSFLVAVIPQGEELYTSYITRTATSSITNTSATQATSDSGGTYREIVQGEYVYTFANRAPVNFDRNATHTVGVYARRDLRDFDLGRPSDDDTYDFVPSGAPVTELRAIVSTESCNACHNRLTLHGRRHSVELCILCHTPQSTDPDTGNTVDFTTMIHKIHMGEDLPSVKDGTPYQIIGFGNNVHDYSEVEFPADVRNCEVCHSGAEEASHYLTDPSRRACGACHDDVNFATGENHARLPQISDNLCSTCHIPQGELDFDLSIKGAHTIPRLSEELPGTVFEILSVTDGGPGQNPAVTYSIKDKEGNPILPSEVDRMSLVLAGPTTDYSTRFSEKPVSDEGTGGVYTHTFAAAIPADATGTYAVSIEGFRSVKLLEGTLKEITARDPGMNRVFYFPVTDPVAVPRREVVAVEKCNSCHFSFSVHSNRRNQTEHCVLCHNPTLTDASRRPEDQMPAEGLNFKMMIHKIHTGHDLEFEYTTWSSRPHEFNEIHFPGDRRDCSTCHVNGSEQLPLAEGLLSAVAPNDYFDPMPPVSGACLSCHTSLPAAAHADLNISPRFGEACVVCHGSEADFSIDRIHAR